MEEKNKEKLRELYRRAAETSLLALSTDKYLEDYKRESDKELEAKYGKQWMLDNKEKLERQWERLRDSGLL